MIICPNCGMELYNGEDYCPNCGARLTAEQPAYAQQQAYTQPPMGEQPPVNEQPIYGQPVYKPMTPPPSIAKAIVAIALSAEAASFAVLSSIYSIIMFSVTPAAGTGFTAIMAIFTLPFAIIGMNLANSYLNSSATKLRPMANAARLIGKISLIVFAAGAGLGLLIGMAAAL